MEVANIISRNYDRNYTKACLERWARWLYGSRSGEISMTGRLMAGVKANVCPAWLEDMQAQRKHDPYCRLCGGRGRLKMEFRSRSRPRYFPCAVCDINGKFAGDWCFRCKGTRVIEVYEMPVNPAGIRGTRSVGGQYVGDIVCTEIDNLVASWRESDATVWWHTVILREYCHNGTQDMKAKQLRCSVSFFKKRLAEATDAVGIMLQEKMI